MFKSTNDSGGVMSVSTLSGYIKSVIEKDVNLSSVYVKGEISNLTDHQKSGHIYFTLKDEGSVIKAVMFSRYASSLRFRPSDGMRVIVFGSVSVYEKGGTYQLYCVSLAPDGVGALYMAFEQLKERLGKEGLFDPAHKKPIPAYPTRIGVITSKTGAVIRDIATVLSRRYPIAELLLFPSNVQGELAAGELTRALNCFNHLGNVDVIIIARGGGSLEELWPFNDEGLARAIYASGIPVISAVGHETDYTIADFVADMRAPTPSAAAECAAPELTVVMSGLWGTLATIEGTLRRQISLRREMVARLDGRIRVSSPEMRLIQVKRDALTLLECIQKRTASELSRVKDRVISLSERINAVSPMNVLTRGYAIAKDREGNVLKSIKDIKKGDNIRIRVTDGELTATVLDTEKIQEDAFCRRT